MAVNVERHVKLHKLRALRRNHKAALWGSLSLVALFTVSWGLKIIGFSLTNDKPFKINTTVDRLDTVNPDTEYYKSARKISG